MPADDMFRMFFGDRDFFYGFDDDGMLYNVL